MNEIAVTMVRIYLTEGEGKLSSLLGYLHDEAKVRGTTVYRGISGFGQSGKYHSSTLLDMSLDLPITLEFFEDTDKAVDIIRAVAEMVDAGHIVTWQAKLIT
jgi:PII-like signaling protein